MTENNIQNKAAYMSCYWGQEVAHYSDGDNNRYIVAVGKHDFSAIHYLELTQLSNISDEHAFEVANIRGFVNVTRVKFVFEGYWATIKQEGKRSVSKFVFYRDMYQPEIDKLREFGYLTDWRDLSIEELLTRGWAKVKQKQ